MTEPGVRKHTHTCYNCRKVHGHNDTGIHSKHFCPKCARKCRCA